MSNKIVSLTKFPWIFWIAISIRKKWFAFFWKERLANCLNIQIWIFNIKIGIPWSKNYLQQQMKDYKTLKFSKNTNEGMKKSRLSFQIGSYEGFFVE